ncbi:AraC family transcriptional regulator [Nocardiopsis coralliicola]
MLDRLNRALERIENDPAAPLDVAAMAREALTTPAHLRRTFSALAGMPLAEYARRRRLTLAAAEVLEGRATLLDIAVRYGYGSNEAFARAFRSLHGTGPAEARRSGAVLTSQPRIAFRLTVEGSRTVDYRIVDKEAFRLAGPHARVPIVYEGRNTAMEEFLAGIPDEVSEQVSALSDQEPRGILGVTAALGPERAEGAEIDYRHAAATSAADTGGLPVLEVPASAWAVFPRTAAVADCPEALQRIWVDAYAEFFPSNPAYRTIDGPELLRVDYPDDSTVEAELWIPVERA